MKDGEVKVNRKEKGNRKKIKKAKTFSLFGKKNKSLKTEESTQREYTKNNKDQGL